MDCVRDDKPIEVVTPQESLAVLKVIRAIQQSLETGELVRIQD